MAKLFWRYGSMGAGKSVALLSVAYNYERIGQKSVIFTTALDDRFGVGKVASRMGISREAVTFTRDTSFGKSNIPFDTACILVDEAQFLTKMQVQELHKIAQLGSIPVICYGLRTDFQGEAFEGSAALGVLADDMEELKMVCKCGSKATMNIRMNGEGKRVFAGDQVDIGADGKYEASCPACFYKE
jgi:thymidine kinase